MISSTLIGCLLSFDHRISLNVTFSAGLGECHTCVASQEKMANRANLGANDKLFKTFVF